MSRCIVDVRRWCEHSESEQIRLFNARDYISGDWFTLWRCRACGLVRTRPIPMQGQTARYYPRSYYGRDMRYSRPLERALDMLYAARARRIVRLSGCRGGSVLDIGCGRGLLLRQLRRLGWEVLGTELNDISADYARQRLGLDVRTGALKEMALPYACFDVIVLWHVLEHFPEPAELLQDVVRILRPGGMLLVAVPDFGSFEAAWGKANWFHLDVPRHLCHLTADNLCTELEACGLQPFASSHFALEYDWFSFVQTALNVLGIQQNTLYNVIRARGAKTLRTKERGIHVVYSLVLAPIFLLIGLVWVPMVTLLHRGATVTVCARKRS